MDLNNTFALMSYPSSGRKPVTVTHLVHIESGKVAKVLDTDGEGSGDSSASIYKSCSRIHTAKFHDATGTIITGSFGKKGLNLYNANGSFRKELNTDFNT